jgi:hypothetical protein
MEGEMKFLGPENRFQNLIVFGIYNPQVFAYSQKRIRNDPQTRIWQPGLEKLRCLGENSPDVPVE